MRYPRRALIEAINIIRFGRPDAPGQAVRPADLDPDATRLFRSSRKSGCPSANVDKGAVRFVPLRLRVEQFGRDPRVPAQTESAGSGGAAEVWFGPRVLAEAIARFKPDLIHSMEFQHCAYLVLETKGMATGRFPMWLASNWGSDIHHFAHFDDHRQRIVRVLGNLDVYAAECERDVALARNLGYAGPVFPVVPSSGGFDLAACARLRAPGPTSARRTVVVKGYQHFVGRALTALRIVAANADLLSDYDVLVYSATPDVVEAAQEIERSQGIRIRCLPRLSHDAMLAVFGRARIYLGLSASDAISTGVLESIVMGAFPIQTDTSCCNEWFSDGDGGFIVDLAAPETISVRLRQALQDDALVDRAAATNWETARRRLDLPTIRRTVVDAYDAALRAAPQGSAAGR